MDLDEKEKRLIHKLFEFAIQNKSLGYTFDYVNKEIDEDMDKKQYDYIYSKMCELGKSLDLLEYQEFPSKKRSITRFHDYQCEKFSESGGFNNYFFPKKILYNVFVETSERRYNIFGIDEQELQHLKNAYISGKPSITFNGTNFRFIDPRVVRIFTFESKSGNNISDVTTFYLGNVHHRRVSRGKRYLPPETLLLEGKEVTNEIMKGLSYGERDSAIELEKGSVKAFINEQRLNEIRELSSKNFDFSKLTKCCEEINDNFSRENYYSVCVLVRAIIDHIPPLFGHKKFEHFIGHYGSTSFKKVMTRLHKSMRSLADGYLHEGIRKSEPLPNEAQIDFRSEVDRLLAEIVSYVKENNP